VPTLAAVEQGIPVVAVKSNTNLMRNDLRSLPFREGQLHYAANYYEAAGILAAMKAGVAPAALARPMQSIRIERVAAPVAANGHANGHVANGNGTNGHATNGKRKKATENGKAVNGTPNLVEVGGE
jgi:hypothetical protein